MKTRKLFDKKSSMMALRLNIELLEEESMRFHSAIRDIVEHIVFHRESLYRNDREIFEPSIRNFQKKMKEFNKEYRQMLRDPALKSTQATEEDPGPKSEQVMEDDIPF